MISRLYLLSFLLILPLFSTAQARFSDRNDLLRERDMHSAVPVAIADMNADGLDDLVTMNAGRQLFIQYQTPDPDRPFARNNLPIGIDNNEQNDIIIADFNRDGANDVFTIGSYDRGKVVYGIPHTYSFDLQYEVLIPFFSQGASAGDFNGDGWIDIVILNDNGLNYTLLNDGAGNLESADFFDFETVPQSDNSGNYGSVYTDFDMDGDNDFYIAKCRQGVNNPADPRRINVLYVNDGTNNYTESAADYGLASGRQTWTADFGDIDNDGDLDCFMTQHDVISELFENINNDTFINITAQSGLNIGGIPLQGMFRDFDNDGFQDILVSGDRVDYYHNNGDLTFTKYDPFGGVVFGTFALGDLNHDGFTDVYASRVIPFNTPDLLREDILFLNDKNDNHFLALQLNNSPDLLQATGALAILYGAWGKQIREVRSGEQYGVSNGHTLIFGLGAETTYDSLVIRWPDGTRESYKELSIDNTWIIEQGGCFHIIEKFWPDVAAICGTDSIVLKLNDNIMIDHWSTGSLSDSIIIKEPGLYYATYRDSNDCYRKTFPLEVIINPDSIKPVIIYEGNSQLCDGDIALLSVSPGLGYHWITGDTEQTIEVDATGDYYAEVLGYCKNLLSDTISLDFLLPDLPFTEQDTFLSGEPATLSAIGDSILWYSDAQGNNVIGFGPLLVLNGLTGDSTVYAQNLSPIDGLDDQVGQLQQSGLTKYNASFINGGLIFEVFASMILKEFTVYSDSSGARIIEITNGSDFHYALEADIDSGATVVKLDLELHPDEYIISTNSERNNALFEDISPVLWRSSDGVDYPYSIPNVMAITNSTYGTQYYYYFYDWKIATSDRFCSSDLIPVKAVLDIKSAVKDPDQGEVLWVTPNPTTGLVKLFLEKENLSEVEVMNIEGKKITHQKNNFSDDNEYWIDLSGYPSGIYILRVKFRGKLIVKRIMKS